MLEHRQMRTIASNFKTRETEDNNLYIEGYFAVFDKLYHIGEGMTESIARGAFKDALNDDIRALTNHDTTLVLGRNVAGTLSLEERSEGLWGAILVNPNDLDAMNTYQRVKRGDVNQCSFGFDILSEETDFREDGMIHWTIKAVKLYEVSVCTFPAYEDTSIKARSAERDEMIKRRNEKWKSEMLKKLKEV